MGKLNLDFHNGWKAGEAWAPLLFGATFSRFECCFTVGMLGFAVLLTWSLP